MEGGESPLEVLSRAATMLQENQQSLSSHDESSKQFSTKQIHTTKWKRDRRSRLPEYSRKSDPKIPEVFNGSSSDYTHNSNSVLSSDLNSNGFSNANNNEESTSCKIPDEIGGNKTNDSPLDMSIRQRGLPPSYQQTVTNPGYRSNYRANPAPVQNFVPPVRDELPTGISMCDPIIDEHFRRSLGNDYLMLFNNSNNSNNISSSSSSAKDQTISSMKTPESSNAELQNNTGLSVDDHFAKALGDTWTKLNKKDTDFKSSTNEGHRIVSL